MFWQDGYQALAALDDDHDGWLRGRELRISDPGEVIPIEQTDIGSIAVRRDGADGISPMNGHGVLLKDGRTLPTWDWVATPLSQ